MDRTAVGLQSAVIGSDGLFFRSHTRCSSFMPFRLGSLPKVVIWNPFERQLQLSFSDSGLLFIRQYSIWHTASDTYNL
jgi:hypothetical protein